MARLTLYYGDEKKNVYQLRKDSVTIGRDDSCDVVIPSGAISRKHAIIERRVAGYYLTDNNSTNGTLVNGLEVDEVRLLDGDEIYMGDVMVMFTYDEIEYEDTAQEAKAPIDVEAVTGQAPGPDRDEGMPFPPRRGTATTRLSLDDIRRKLRQAKMDDEKNSPL